MKDGGAIILFVIGLLTSLQFIARYFIEPILKKRNGEKTEFSKIKIGFTICYFLFFLILLIMDLFGFFSLT